MTAATGDISSLHRRLDSSVVRSGVVDRGGPILVVALGFFSFMPYPGIPIGKASAVQLGNLLTVLLLVPALALPGKRRAVWLYPLILAPLILSAVKVGMTDGRDLDLCFKSIIAWGLACLTIVATQIYAPRNSLHLLTGIAIATLVHAAVGMLQLYSFSNGEFPLVDLYVNQSFDSVQDNAFFIAHWIQRPFGLFSEPSAMASSLAPWILLWVAEMCGIMRFREEPTRGLRILFAAAAAGGLSLIILSRSGHTMITLAALLVLGVVWLFKARATRRTFGIVLLVFGLIVPLILGSAAFTMSDRIGGELHTAGGSWDERSDSLAIGFSILANSDPATILFGLGAGLASPAVQKAAGLDAIWSVSLTYLYETGFIGAIVFASIAVLLIRVFRDARWNLAFALITLVWLLGITLTTSYGQLLPIWMMLGWLTVWPVVCAPSQVRPARLTDSFRSRPTVWKYSRQRNVADATTERPPE
jgi:hypothetical protein